MFNMKKYKYKKIRDKVKKIVKAACFSPSNKYKKTVWSHHILSVVKHSLTLGKKLKADLEVLELSAYLHDYSSIYNFKFASEHHIHSAKMAGEMLNDFNYPEDKIERIKQCILCHRGSKPRDKKFLEDKILSSADAMSHFTELADMMYLTYGVHEYNTIEGAIWLKAKLLRSWRKVIPKGKIIIDNEYRIAINILNIAINNHN